jgi:NAD(P)-dependent dehydrogenase (short-subunit alcohol dehydrogenase family)
LLENGEVIADLSAAPQKMLAKRLARLGAKIAVADLNLRVSGVRGRGEGHDWRQHRRRDPGFAGTAIGIAVNVRDDEVVEAMVAHAIGRKMDRRRNLCANLSHDSYTLC